ncbi:MAG: hypothetical protein KAR20_19935 [Candidatus Heimdallarchaeota archaeon]|nr:hypothetical protein [Candidatus Heimdallarchaeota archaeon]
MAHDASATWSGFNYQGKVAIFYALSLINEGLDEDIEFDFSTYELILENHEDFEIKKDGVLMSVHQVKAYNASSYSNYNNALIELALELQEYPDATGYLHTWQIVSIPAGETLISKITASIQNIITEYDNTQDKSTSIIGKTSNAAISTSKKVKIIKRAFEGIGTPVPTEQQVKL